MKRNKYPLHPSLTGYYDMELRTAKMLQGKRKPHDFSIPRGRKLRPYGKNLCPWINEDSGAQSFYTGSNFRNRKVVRRYQRKALRAQYKRELFSAIEDHISESMSIYIWCDFWEDYAVRVSPDEFDDYCASIGL